MAGRIKRNAHIFLSLPSDILKEVEIKPNTIIEVGKLGSFPSNLLIGRPYYHTYEILEKRADEAYPRLRIVPTSELNAETVTEDETPSESRGDPATPRENGASEGFDIVADDGTVIMKNNRLTIDDASRQKLSHTEIEELKKSSGGKDIIEKILASHTALDEKTAFSKAKYTLRKSKKYLKRFTVLPIELGDVIDYVLEKEPGRIMELREESLGLISAWSNAHFTELPDPSASYGGKWLVVDDTGGLVTAAIAERMGLLRLLESKHESHAAAPKTGTTPEPMEDVRSTQSEAKNHNGEHTAPDEKTFTHHDFPSPSSNNSITVLHSAVQPNLSLLKYFGYDTNQPDPDHPLHTHLKSLSWLQLLHPDEDPTYKEPENADETAIQSWKSSKRGTYFKKRRRWERCRDIVDDARSGAFDGLVIASHMDPATILPHAVPLVRGGGHVVIYSPTVERLTQIMDLYSRDRRAAYIDQITRNPDEVPDPDDFPLDPRALLAPTLQTSRVREYQVLPGRTHPLMTSRGGTEGYILTARKVIPLEGGVEARGNFGKKRKVDVMQPEPSAAS